MSGGENIFSTREWMYKRVNSSGNVVSDEFVDGINQFLSFARNSISFSDEGVILCPCKVCKNRRRFAVNIVGNHLYRQGFMPNYYLWTCHGEGCEIGESSSYAVPMSVDQVMRDDEIPTTYEDFNRVSEMVHDAFPDVAALDLPESPRGDAKNFFNLLEEASEPIYDGGVSRLCLATEMMNMKTEYNLSEVCMDGWARLFKKRLPDNNSAPASYYEVKKMTRSLGLPYQKIDACENNCMLFWKDDISLTICRFCKSERFRPRQDGNKSKNVAKQRMFYLPIADRLKRLFTSKKTAEHMRWHAEHERSNGEMQHPSDAVAWKHFQEVYPEFAYDSRNVYLGLSTDGFNPLGMQSHNHSVWPVIVTPYNLPPEMCMKREYLFLSILVPGPNHPKKSLDIFLQPLVDELQQLWSTGVSAYDVSKKQNFIMRAALMWTISDFPAYGMLSGWMTHGRLSCPYCKGRTHAFQLQHGRKTSWFDCHRDFLEETHPYRRNLTAFRKNTKMVGKAPKYPSSEQVPNLPGIFRTPDCGGNGHDSRRIMGYGVDHNWIKKSIFWDLPYWKDQLLKHNLDVMHIEKNFFDNIMNTLLNVKGKTKDNMKSRLDLPEICRRKDLELRSGLAPVPIFRLSKEARIAFLQWLKRDIKFPDGYVSNISKCVDEEATKLSGLKSHDCHVIMQRLFPIAFTELLPKNVHIALSDIGLFFRDICAKSLKVEDVEILKRNIAVKICNLEKIFPPSFFDVMEHLPVHLPEEALLGGPVQFRWMYPFERFMHHLKKKAKNKAQIGGSIVAQSVNEEISYFTSYYFGDGDSSFQRADDCIDIQYDYADVPSTFRPVGRVGGKPTQGWLDENDARILQTYLLLNCPEIEPYER